MIAGLLAEAGRAAAEAIHPAEAASVAADLARRLPPPHVLPPRGATPPDPGLQRWVALSWEPIFTTAAGLAVGMLALWGLLDLVGGGVGAESPPPDPRPVAVSPAAPTGSGYRVDRRML